MSDTSIDPFLLSTVDGLLEYERFMFSHVEAAGPLFENETFSCPVPNEGSDCASLSDTYSPLGEFTTLCDPSIQPEKLKVTNNITEPAAMPLTKKRKAWGQDLPIPTTNLPPRKRAKTAEEKEQRRIERVLRNRAAAQSSRERKQKEVLALEEERARLAQSNDEMKARLAALEESNRALSLQLEGMEQTIKRYENSIKVASDVAASSNVSQIDRLNQVAYFAAPGCAFQGEDILYLLNSSETDQITTVGPPNLLAAYT